MNKQKVYVFKLKHRLNRDKRASTHLLLAARAFGADGALYSGQRDEKIEESIKKVNEAWGDSFEVEYARHWRRSIEQWKKQGGEVIHLTMYGLPIKDVIELVRESQKDKLIVVGGAKVPGIVYELADWNVSVTSQPHSEISALSVFLHELYEGTELSRTFEGARIRIIPHARGKKVVKKEI